MSTVIKNIIYKMLFISENGKTIEMSCVLGCGAESPSNQYPMFHFEIPYPTDDSISLT